MTFRRAIVSLGVLLVMVVIWMGVTVLPAQQQLGDAERKPTPACQGYNTENFAFRAAQLKAKQAGSDGKEPGQKGDDADPEVAVATLEVACQSNAIARSGVQVDNVTLIIAVVAVALSTFALVVPVLLAEMGGGLGAARNGADLAIDVLYGGGGTAAAWTMLNRGRGVAFVHGVSVIPYSGGSGASIAVAATFTGGASEVAAGRRGPIVWTGTPFVGESIVAVRHSDGLGRRGIAWARFALHGSPVRQEKQEEGYVAES